MNLRKIFNAGRNPNPPVSISDPSMLRGGGLRSGVPIQELQEASEALSKEYPKPLPPDAPTGDYEKRFGGLRNGNFYPTSQIMAMIGAACPAGKVRSLYDALVEKEKIEDALHAELGKHAPANVIREWKQQHMTREHAQRRGQHEGVLFIERRDDILERAEPFRDAIRAKLHAVRAAVRPIAQELCEVCETAARKVAIKLEGEELAQAEKYGVDFAPSMGLVIIAYLGLVGFKNRQQQIGSARDVSSYFKGLI